MSMTTSPNVSTLRPASEQLESSGENFVSAPPAVTGVSGHSAVVRVTHWLTALCFLALVISGAEIVVSHPRFYWGETGSVLTRPLFQIPIPSSRRLVPSGYNYVLPDQNGWSRALHFQTAWLLVLTGLLYIAAGLITGHFINDLLPRTGDLTRRSFMSVIVGHWRSSGPPEEGSWSYNVLQRLTYLFVVFILFPMEIWTGLALSPAFDSAFPATVVLLGGRQSARTLHFCFSVLLVLFVLMHIALVWCAGFIPRVRAMITGRTGSSRERP